MIDVKSMNRIEELGQAIEEGDSQVIADKWLALKEHSKQYKLNDKQDECFNRCPKCDSGDVKWGDKDWGDYSAWQNATCKECGCEFTEVYEYVYTEIDESVEASPHPCPNPDQ